MITPKVMHLFLLKTCRHHCPLCCNLLYNIDEIPVATVEELKTVETVCFTGGEPFFSGDIGFLAVKIKKQFPNVKNIYVYTSGLSLLYYLQRGRDLRGIDGVTVSPKDKTDWDAFEDLVLDYKEILKNLSSNRLYVFINEGEEYYNQIKDIVDASNFKMIERIWDPKFDTPEDEIFRRLPILLD